MALQIPRRLVEFILLGPEDDRRQLQDSPILGDVWIEFAKSPGAKQELLITPYKNWPAGLVAAEIAACTIEDAHIAYLQGIVAARLTLEEVLRWVVPMTFWWTDKRMAQTIDGYLTAPGQGELRDDIASILAAAEQWLRERTPQAGLHSIDTRKRYIALAGLLLWASQKSTLRAKRSMSNILLSPATATAIADILVQLYQQRYTSKKPGTVWTVSLNRRAMPALVKSVPAVKADAARTLFSVDCSEIVWAVIDSGIDATHDAFRDFKALSGPRKEEKTRVERAFDFTNIRDILRLDAALNAQKLGERVDALLDDDRLKDAPPREEIEKALRELADDASKGRSIDWGLVERLVEIKLDTRPLAPHGTHVAGILAADMRSVLALEAKDPGAKPSDDADGGEPASEDRGSGMCPEMRLYDFRVLAHTVRETEFAIIAALQFIRYLNERSGFMTIHGANLSLSIPHDVRNYACGRTPVCNECERLVNSGVVVVAAAGNRGYQGFETSAGTYESYAAFSITDPGNADGVITVGATHRYWPQTYGVSFFSSRGPTGDGRLKPDLVAPGERIRAPLPGNEWGDLDGTSMAAPHVSGAAAMLMARYSELVGQPRRIKTILCDSATDLGRERTFQGRGMLDILRAFQSI